MYTTGVEDTQKLQKVSKIHLCSSFSDEFIVFKQVDNLLLELLHLVAFIVIIFFIHFVVIFLAVIPHVLCIVILVLLKSLKSLLLPA